MSQWVSESLALGVGGWESRVGTEKRRERNTNRIKSAHASQYASIHHITFQNIWNCRNSMLITYSAHV